MPAPWLPIIENSGPNSLKLHRIKPCVLVQRPSRIRSRAAAWLQTSCGVQKSLRQISVMESHICGSNRMFVRCPRTLTLRITSALCPVVRPLASAEDRIPSGHGSSFEARRKLGKAETMGAIRICVAAPDSQPWKAHYKPRVVNFRFARRDACNPCRNLALFFCKPYTDT